jgi:hypothetical protein
VVLAVHIVEFQAQVGGAGGTNALEEDMVYCFGYAQTIYDAGGAEGTDGGPVFVIISSMAHGPGR